MRWPWRRERDLDEEIASHLAMAAEDRRADGTPARDADIGAHREFGNVALVKEVTTIALAVGANVAVFSLVDRLVLHPLNVPDADRLVTPQSSMMMRGVANRGSRRCSKQSSSS